MNLFSVSLFYWCFFLCILVVVVKRLFVVWGLVGGVGIELCVKLKLSLIMMMILKKTSLDKG